MTILVTGAAGFIGAYLCKALHLQHENVIGLDNFNAYYDPQLKYDRIAALCPDVDIRKIDITNRELLTELFNEIKPRYVIHLAAQAGVRYSLKNPYTYTDSNISGFINILECCRHFSVEHLVYASSSSVYGNSATPPYSENQRIDQPRSLYAATKAANELMAYSYSELYGLRATALRFFTVYGAWGRPDMAPILFSRAILSGREIDVFNYGKMKRDFTYIDDIVAGIIGALHFNLNNSEYSPRAENSLISESLLTSENPLNSENLSVSENSPRAEKLPLAENSLSSENYPSSENLLTSDNSLISNNLNNNNHHQIFNLGNHTPVELEQFIQIIENTANKTAKKNYLPMQLGDMLETMADTQRAKAAFGFEPSTSLQNGLPSVVEWCRDYFGD